MSEETRKSISSRLSSGSMPSQSISSHSAVFLKWRRLGSDFICAISASHSSRTGDTSMRSISSKSVV